MKIIKTEKVKKVNPIKEMYCGMVGIDKNTRLTEDMLDETVLESIGADRNMPRGDITKILLEDTMKDRLKAVKDNAEVIDGDESKTRIERILDEMLQQSEEAKFYEDDSEYPFVILEGGAGIGKTTIVEKWCKDKGFNVKIVDLASLPIEALTGVIFGDPSPDRQYAATRKLSTELLRPLSRPDSVLFFDEYNRADFEIRSKLLRLVINHSMTIPSDSEQAEKFYSQYGEIRDDGTVYFPNLIFVVVAQNPISTVYRGTKELDQAEISRAKIFDLYPDAREHLIWLKNKLGNKIKKAEAANRDDLVRMNKGRLAIATKLRSDPDFRYSTTEELERMHETDVKAKGVDPRSLTSLLMACNGTKKDFLDRWTTECGKSKEKKDMAVAILSDYEDIDDVATMAVKNHKTKSKVFKGKDQDDYDRVTSTLKDLGIN